MDLRTLSTILLMSCLISFGAMQAYSSHIDAAYGVWFPRTAASTKKGIDKFYKQLKVCLIYYIYESDFSGARRLHANEIITEY